MKKNESEELISQLIKIADEKKAEHICRYEMGKDYFVSGSVVVLSHRNKIHCRALAEELNKFARQNGEIRVSGDPDSEWVILDLMTDMIHIISPQLREYYELDKLFEKHGVVYHS